MQPTLRLFQHSLRLTFFTHEHCSLCGPAKLAISKVWDTRPFDYDEIDILARENEKWRQLYQNDIPVVRPGQPLLVETLILTADA